MECFSFKFWAITQPTRISTTHAVFERAGLWLWFVVDEPAGKACLVGAMVGV